jgi:uncharacterized membrane protein (UPF0127 family)
VRELRADGLQVSTGRAASGRPTWRRAISVGSRIWLFFALLVVAQSCGDPATVVVIGSDGAPRARLKVEVADTNQQRMVGLMFRDNLPADAGMLFVFKSPGRLSFWMKNTRIPLDMIFAGSTGRIVGIVANAEPFSETSLSVDGESQFVLEVNGGFCRKHGIQPGDRLKFEGFSPVAKD